MSGWRMEEFNGQTIFVYSNDEPDPAEPEPPKCIECGKILPPGRKRYCSDLCAWKHHHGQWDKYSKPKVKPKPKPKQKKCPVCGKPIDQGRFCSEECDEFWNRMLKLSQNKGPSAHETMSDKTPTKSAGWDEIAKKAEEAGMSYGQYVARYEK